MQEALQNVITLAQDNDNTLQAINAVILAKTI